MARPEINHSQLHTDACQLLLAYGTELVDRARYLKLPYQGVKVDLNDWPSAFHAAFDDPPFEDAVDPYYGLVLKRGAEFEALSTAVSERRTMLLATSSSIINLTLFDNESQIGPIWTSFHTSGLTDKNWFGRDAKRVIDTSQDQYATVQVRAGYSNTMNAKMKVAPGRDIDLGRTQAAIRQAAQYFD